MSLIDGGAPSADWVALDMEAMLRECDGVIAAKDDQVRRLAKTMESLGGEMAKATGERQQAFLARQKAADVLHKFRAAIEEAAGLRAIQGQGAARLHLVAATPDPIPSTERTPSSHGEPVTISAAPLRIEGDRSIAVMKVVSGDPRRAWSTAEVARLLEGGAKGADRRTRFLLQRLYKLSALDRVYSPDGKRTYYRLSAEWEAA